MGMVIKPLRGTESGIGKRPKAAELMELMKLPVGQHCPKHCPTQPVAPGGQPAASGARDRLGQPLDIRQVARLVGCSPWSIRNTWIRKGLPHFRSSGASSKLIFYEAQIVRWIEKQQGGINCEPLQAGQRLVDELLHRRHKAPGKYRR